MTIMCSLIDGDPPIAFEWTKDGQLATSFPGVKVVSHEFSSMLTITAASIIHSGHYYCRASNPVSWSMVKATIAVDGIVGCLTNHHSSLEAQFQGKFTCDILSGVKALVVATMAHYISCCFLLKF